MGPVGHWGIALPVAHLLKLNLVVTGFCAMLPDLIDKPLWAFGIGNGRFISHTLLFMFVVAFIFLLKSKRYGLSALFGMTSHLLLDWNVPWFFPILHRELPDYGGFSLYNLLRSYISFSSLGKEVVWVASLCSVAVLYLALILWLRKRSRQRISSASRCIIPITHIKPD